MSRAPILLATVLFASCGEGGVREAARLPGLPLPGLSAADSQMFAAGARLFERTFTPAEGLGPLFNERRCASCHDLPSPGGTGVEDATRVARFEAGRCDLLTAEGGPVIQHHATPELERRGIRYERVPRRATAIAHLVPPALYGLGLLEAISDTTLLAHAKEGRIGRFGRKGEFATIRAFVADAAMTEMGLTSLARPDEARPDGQALPPGADPVREPEISEAMLDTLAAFVRFLAPPARDTATGARLDTLNAGERLFGDIGCAGCHVPSFTTAPDAAPALRERIVRPYSDLLLHDLGANDASVCSSNAGPGEWRTAPLMGIRLRQRLMHDGRAGTIDAAIRLHGGEASRARDAYERLARSAQVAVVRFVHSR